jgi:hypothetical protein
MVHVDAKEHVLGMPYQRHVNMVNKQKGLCWITQMSIKSTS